ncbi:MAG TPA: MASE1 domain-containing protein, partial [Nocardioidaceae bacterium]
MSRRLPAGPPGRTGPRPAFVARHPLLLVAGLLAAVFLLGVTSVLLAPADTRVAVWWPAAGLSAVLLLLAPRAWRPRLVLAVALVSALANSAAGRPVAVAAGFGLANAAEAYVVAWWLTRGSGGRPSLRTMDDLRRLLVATVLGALVIGAGVGATVGLLLGGDALAAARTVTASHGAAILVIAPLALRVGASPLHGRRAEAAAQ